MNNKLDELRAKFEQIKEKLEKSAKDNALHKLFRDLSPHVNSAHLFNLKEDKDSIGEAEDGQPHPRGLVGYNIDHHPSKRDIVNKILENHGHFKDKGAFGEDMADADNHTQYGALALHPENAKNLKASVALSRDNMQATPPAGSAVQDPAIGSMNLFEGSATGEGNAKPAKWQGSDPRKNNYFQRETTKAGQPIAQPSSNNFSSGAAAATSGVSGRGYSRTETGQPVKLTKAEAIIADHEDMEKASGKTRVYNAATAGIVTAGLGIGAAMGHQADMTNQRNATPTGDNKSQMQVSPGKSKFADGKLGLKGPAYPKPSLHISKEDAEKSEGKGVHTSNNPASPGRSQMGIMARLGETGAAKVEAKATLKEMKKLPKPKLTKGDAMETLECSANGQWNIVEKSLDPSKYSWKHVGSDRNNHNYSVHYADKKVGDMHVERNAKPGDRVAGGNWGNAHSKNIDHVAAQVTQHAASIDKPRLVESKKV